MHAAFVSPVIFDILGDGGSEDTDSPAFSLLLPPLSKMTADCNMQQMRSVLLKTGCKKTGSGQHENRKERIPETGGGSIKVAWRGLEDRRTDRRGRDKGAEQTQKAWQRGRELY